MEAALAAIDPRAPLPQVMIGDPEYYGRFWGFSAAPTAGWTLPGPYDPRRLLVRAANPAVLPAAGSGEIFAAAQAQGAEAKRARLAEQRSRASVTGS